MPAGQIDFLPHLEEAHTFLNTLGIENFYFFGGALRDLSAGVEHADIDVKTQLPETELWHEISEVISPLALKKAFLPTRLSEIFLQESSQQLRLKLVRVFSNGLQLRLNFNSKSNREQEIDISLLREPISPITICKTADAPMNAIACNESGKSWSHRHFEHDLQKQYYTASSDLTLRNQCVAILRYERLRNKFNDLRYIPNRKSAIIYQGWTLSPDMVKTPLMARHLRHEDITPIHKSPALGYIS